MAEGSSEQTFRERVGFVVLCIIGFYCIINMMVMLKTILEPLLWALFLVMGIMPAVDRVEHVVLRVFYCRIGDNQKKYDYATVNGHDDDLGLESDEESFESEELQNLAENGSSPAVSPGNSPSLRGKSHNPPPSPSKTRVSRMSLKYGLEHDIPVFSIRKAFARMIAVGVVLSFLVMIAVCFGLLIVQSARHMKDNWDVYRLGVERWANESQSWIGYIFQKVPHKMIQEISRDSLKSLQDFLYSWLADIVNNVSHGLVEGLLTLFYMLFWLCTPVPMKDHVDRMFRRYILMKTFVCLGYGTCVALLLYLLAVDLAVVFGLITFVLNYVPEIGPFFAMLLPTPVILLDSRLERPFVTFLSALGGQLAFKFLFGNLVEVKLIESDAKMRLHPVIILLSVAFFGFLWGPTGMLLSVPLVALLKIAVLSSKVPASYRDPILTILEGDSYAPKRHFHDQQRRLHLANGDI